MFNNGISLNAVLIPKLLNKPFASCSLTNFDFLIPQKGHFDCPISLFFCSKHFWVSIFTIFFTLHTISLHLIFITSAVNLSFVLKTSIYFIDKQHSEILL